MSGRSGLLRGSPRLRRWRRIAKYLAGDLPRPRFESVPFEATGTIQARFLIGAMGGLYLYDHGQLHHLLTAKGVYGITRSGDRWYVFHKAAGAWGTILSFHLGDGPPTDVRSEIRFLSAEVHQIDVWDDRLYVADTKHNRVRRYRFSGGKARHDGDFYPAGRKGSGQNAHDVHLNSVFCCDERVWLIYHNLTLSSGRKSQIAVLSPAMEVLDVIDTDAGCAHNIALWNGAPVYCDSQASSLVSGQESIPLGFFTRGLAMSNDFWLVGGSEFARRQERKNSTGRVFAYDPGSRAITEEIRIPSSGSVFEIRLLSHPDLALSEVATGQARSRGPDGSPLTLAGEV